MFKSRDDPSKDLDEIIQKLRDSEFGGSFRFGPVSRPESYPSPDRKDALAAIERRFGLYFKTRRVTEHVK